VQTFGSSPMSLGLAAMPDPRASAWHDPSVWV